MLSPAAFAMLRRLADGAIHSSAVLSEATGLARRQIPGLVGQALEAGIDLRPVRGRGYRLDHAVAFIDPQRVREFLGPLTGRFAVDFVEATGSTNTDLLVAARRGSIEGRVRVAELQTAGRGRHGRPWQAALGGSLTFSLGWRIAQPAAALGGLSLAVGVGSVRALERVHVGGVQLKWPNDLVWQGHKLAGILVECVPPPAAATSTTVVIGIGVNVRLPGGLREAIAQPVTDLARITGRPVDRDRLLATMLREIAGVLVEFERSGFAALREEWTRAHAYQDLPVRLQQSDGRGVQGRVAGVADDGALLLVHDGVTERVIASELSLRH